ncbi:thioredoxin family protein [Hydrogenophaga intermedia]|jgi:thioredoxin 1|uniref:thioredoxin family protein n=1 Tax=Hydrogenophaga intermedia TaxID=65786 RepID=UPI00204428E8|nr:thioredoxin family protein [Hydrogenophaga intermedia]MCM3565866.1 thioredoxin family protein [Hydrogenophaga intermedia]
MTLDVVCLCADWCGTCRDYRPEFETLTGAQPDWRTRWVDVEDFETVLDDVDITTFPLILIVDGAGTLCFAGPVTPQPGMLQRLCQAAQLGSLRATEDQAATWQPLLRVLQIRDE